MKTAVYEGPRTVTVKNVPDAKVVIHPGSGNGRTGTFSHHTTAELRRDARAKGVEGRSHVNKQQLEEALGR
ncbi:hypothetical protein [Streptomyces goshikiensis]|uniref:hypothetical protein n=1 Tax=Streptomyces goshikiensis TaxID=1942 RepID=UPI003647551D